MILLGLLLVLLGAPSPAFARPVDDWACVVCHPSRDRVVFDLMSRDDRVLLGSESAQAFVCRSCHNGSVVDSRDVLDRGAQHPSGVPVDRPVPKPFRLYPGGRMECGTCHSPHGEAPGAVGWQRVAAEGNEPCVGCHTGHGDRHLGRVPAPDAMTRIVSLGGRVGSDSGVVCATCHRSHGGWGKALLVAPYATDRDDLCRVCHRSVSVKGGAPGEPGVSCAACHTAHLDRPLLMGEASPCLECHPGRSGQGEHPTAAPTCGGCHSIHSPVRPSGSPAGLLRLPAASGLLCAPCHPGVGKGHGAGGRPAPAAVGLLGRRNLPLDPAGQLDCTTCHRSHGATERPLLRMEGGIMCLYCHPGANPYGPGGNRAGRHPIGVPLAGEAGVLTCTGCHRAHPGQEAPVAPCVSCHPGQTGGGGHAGQEGCGACHGIHAEGAAESRCGGCHEQAARAGHVPAPVPAGTGLPAFGDGGVPSPWGRIGCSTCHDPHRRPGKGTLRQQVPGGLCLSCHPDKRALAEGSHGPGEEGADPCVGCHPAHPDSAAHGRADAGLCSRCHGTDLEVLPAHGPNGPPAWKGLSGRLPLFDRFGARNDFGFIGCPTCHDVHRPGSFRLEPRDPPQLCLACHGEKAPLLGSTHDPRTGSGGDACGVCHPVHSRGDEPPQWALRAAARGTWNDRKCSGCHGSPAEGPRPHGGPGSHPINVVVPADRKVGDLRLYDPLGGRYGRNVACSTCHDLHGTWGTGGDPLPFYLRKDPRDGALCLTCHPAAGAVTGTVHDLHTREPTVLGPCGPCHVAHGATEEHGLWGLDTGPGEYAPNRLCRSCHGGDDGVDAGLSLMQHHMKDAEELRTPRGTIYLQRPMLLLDEIALRSGEPPVLPLYDRDGRPGPDGNLQCVSCHDPHQWSPMGPFVKPGFGALGENVPTGFLRLKNPEDAVRSVCSGCHPDDGARRYQEYHRVWSDVGDAFQ